MLRYMVALILLASSTSSYDETLTSAASPAQIRFAIENKYDDTGPGAKTREYAYHTYKTLDEALLGFIDDPDTKLPDFEREKAIRLLYSRKPYKQYGPKPEPLISNDLFESKQIYNGYDTRYTDLSSTGLQNKRVPFRLPKLQLVKANPLNIAHYIRNPVDPFDNQPKYKFSYGVHDPKTGDLKLALETRDGDLVHGYYSFRDPDGKQRTVQYQADDKLGFRAIVRREFPPVE